MKNSLIEKSDINKHFGKYKFEKMSDLETFFECEIIKQYLWNLW